MPEFQWQLQPQSEVPQWLKDLVKIHLPDITSGEYGAKLLWQRGIQTPDQAQAFLDSQAYQPTSPFAFAEEMNWAVQRLEQAKEKGEIVTIWGDFDADGVTATSVLWEGLGVFFLPNQTLNYYIPHRLEESHGLNRQGIKKLAKQGTQLIVTCDTGSNNLAEMALAQELGIDIIITDHHTLPPERPPVVSIINPRYFPANHPLYHLSGVAVAYKLVEAIYLILRKQPPPDRLLDLVAIGLIADLVQLTGDCRYLAQKGIEQLKKQGNPHTTDRPGVFHLLNNCRRTGDRPTDIAFGIGPRINAVSRMYGDSGFLVELLTSEDPQRCAALAADAEAANQRRKSLQQQTTQRVKQKLEQLDLSTTCVIVLEDPQWPPGVLGLVANTIAREYNRPTILLSSEGETARGSARSLNNIDLYELVSSQAHLLTRFGGHPFAAGLSLPLANLPLFTQGINQVARNQLLDFASGAILPIDLVVTVKDLGKGLFKELALLEPLGMGNPIPKLLVQNCRFHNLKQRNIIDRHRQKLKYVKTSFFLTDDSTDNAFPGVWWEHYAHELSPAKTYNVVVELDYRYQDNGKGGYEVRLVDWQYAPVTTSLPENNGNFQDILDWRGQKMPQDQLSSIQLLPECPQHWTEIVRSYYQARQQKRQLALAYDPDPKKQDWSACGMAYETIALETWRQLVGIAKHLQRTGKIVSYEQLQSKLGTNDRCLSQGIEALASIGFVVDRNLSQQLRILGYQPTSAKESKEVRLFLHLQAESQFQKHYFSRVPLEVIAKTLVLSLK